MIPAHPQEARKNKVGRKLEIAQPHFGQVRYPESEVYRVTFSPRCRSPFESQRWSRRRMLQSVIALSTTLALSACGGFPPIGGNPRPSTTPATPSGLFGIFPPRATPVPTATPQPITLRFAHWESGAAAQTLAAIAQKFHQMTSGVVVQPSITSFRAHFDALLATTAGGTPPDVFINSGAYFYDLANQKVMRDLTGLLRQSSWSAKNYWTEPTTRAFNGHQYTLPIWNADEVVFFNRDWFAQKKVTEPSENWSWDQFLATAQALTDGKPGQVTRWGVLVTNDVQGGWGSFVASNGGSWLDVAQRRMTLQLPTATAALQWLIDLAIVHHVAPRPSEQQRLTQGGEIDPFVAGLVAMLPTGTWEMTNALQEAHFAWDILKLPRAPQANTATTVSNVQPVSASAASQHPDQAWQFLEFLISPDAQTMLAHNKIKLPALKAIAESSTSGYATTPPQSASIVAQSMDHAVDLAFLPHWQSWRAAVIQALEPAFEGSATLSDAIAEAVRVGNAALTT